MKLSEKLAALEDDDEAATAAPAGSTAPKARQANGHDPVRVHSTWETSKRKMRDLVLADLAPRMQGLEGAALVAEVKTLLDKFLTREDVKVSPAERRRFVDEVIQDTLGYGPLEPRLKDETVTEFVCNAHSEIWVERSGRLERTPHAVADEASYRHVIERIVGGVGRRVDESSPMVDARLPDGSRINAIIPPLAVHGSVLTIRKFATDPYEVKDLISFGSI